MTDGKRNLAASVTARLLNRARQTSDDYQTLFRAYCFERVLRVIDPVSASQRLIPERGHA
jgi:hypothetical protein